MQTTAARASDPPRAVLANGSASQKIMTFNVQPQWHCGIITIHFVLLTTLSTAFALRRLQNAARTTGEYRLLTLSWQAYLSELLCVSSSLQSTDVPYPSSSGSTTRTTTPVVQPSGRLVTARLQSKRGGEADCLYNSLWWSPCLAGSGSAAKALK